MRAGTWCVSAMTVVLAAAVYSTPHAQAAKTTKDGVYTAEQAARGEKVYADNCASCHGDDLGGGGFAPALNDKAFLDAYAGQKLEDLSSRIRETMPADKPGTLSADANADLLAFVLKSNTFAAGATPLPTDKAALQAITIVKP